MADRFRERFEANQRILTFSEYLEIVAKDPVHHCRDAAGYVRDTFEHFGSRSVARPWGQERRWSLFDIPYDEGRDSLIGQEAAQDEFYRLVRGFAHEGRVDRLIVLNGPNGSAKSTLVSALMRALEEYSTTKEGALYTFNWVFPSRTAMGRIGFRGRPAKLGESESFAHLLDEDIDAKLKCEVRDHPLLILDRDERLDLLQRVSSGKLENLPDLILRGGLCHKCKQVFDALVTAYHGDLNRVLQHVQIERWYISRTYRRGAVTIGPQMSVDAGERQISADRSLSALPSSLQMTALFEPNGELVDASGGLLEFSDLLKRPLEAFRYLLSTIETSEASLGQTILRLNNVMVATTNDRHLAAFREHPEYLSFRGRLSVVKVPYIRDYQAEQNIYDTRVVPNVRRHVAPHATEACARWAVLTRLLRPDFEKYPKEMQETIKGLSAAQKADLYAVGKVPDEVKAQSAEELRSLIGDLYAETADAQEYEGRHGASPREVRALLAAAAQDELSKCLSPRAVFRQIHDLCRRKEEHSFLDREAQPGGYEGAEELIEDAEAAVLDAVENELRTATGLIAEKRHLELLEKYVIHVRHWVKGEKLPNKITGRDEDADQALMSEVESRLEVPKAKIDDFRKSVISSIAGFAIENPGAKLEIAEILPDHLNTLRASYYAELKDRVAQVGRDILAILREDRVVPAEAQELAETTLRVMKDRFGYCDACVGEALTDLVRIRYDD